ncbi:MAG: hypothetical protein IJ204_03640 [Paludibacteraceae bacterium]|nr:hypothetical protein [Paludibacteraceae bacterium]
MSKFLHQLTTSFSKALFCGALLALPLATLQADDFQLTNAGFEDWSGATFNGEIQPKGWNASNVEQVGFKFNFAHRDAGHTGQYSMMVQDQEVGAFGITETSPGYFSIGKPWAYLDGLDVNGATAGTEGGQAWTHRPDSMSVWIRRTGNNTDKEDFYLLYYAWSGKARGDKYKAKSGGCTSTTRYDEESDVRLALNGNECGTTTKVTQVCEGMWREKKTYGNWTNIRVPIYYMNNTVPTTMNIIFSASNYPNFRANSGLYPGNSLYVDDIELIYSSKIQKLYMDGKEWKGFDPNTSDIQTYSLGETATAVPTIEAVRGAGALTNAKGTPATFPGRTLSGSEIAIEYGDLQSKPTVITVKSEDGKSTTTYRIQFQRAASSNAKLAGITINGTPLDGFSPAKYNYTIDLPYGTTAAPVVDAEGQEDKQTIKINQPASPTGSSTITVTAANGTSTATYNLTFRVAALADNTLKDILINGTSLPGFTPTQAVYKVSLPTYTTTMPTVKAVSAYPDGEQTIVYTAPSTIDGGTYLISVTTPGNTIAKVYKLNFKLEASSYTYLKDLQVVGEQIQKCNPAKADDSTQIAFSPDFMTYFIRLKMGTTSLPQILWTPGDEYQTIEKTEGGLDGTTRVTVTAGNKADQTVYKLIFSTEKSEISTLSGIKVGGVMIDGFASDKTSYTYNLPAGTTELPEIEPVPGDEYQSVTKTTAGINGKTRITVTAGNGSTTVYQIAFSVDSYTDNTLQWIKLDGVLIDGWDPETNEYYVNLPQGTTKLPEVTYLKQDEQMQNVSERKISGTSGDYKLTVRPTGGASRTYIIHFSVATSNNTALQMIYLDGAPLAGFNAEKTEYTIDLPEGVSLIPAVTFLAAEESQRVLSVLENRVQTITVTAASGAKRTYTVTFKVTLSANAFLNMIYLDSVALDGFKKDSTNYEKNLTSEKCPAITVDKAPGQQVTITAPYGAGTAYIKVQPEQGTANTYTIKFVPVAAASARLSMITVNGEPITGFDAAKLHYTASYERVLPTVAYVKGDESQTVNVLWKDSVAWLHVADTLGNKTAYSVTFSRHLLDNKSLKAILIDGVEMAEFNAATLDYTRDLAAGSNYPKVTYIAADDAEVIFFGQVAKGKWAITVSAEDGSKQTYTVAFNILPYTDATLDSLEVAGYTISFDPNTFSYDGLVIDEGVALPALKATGKPGQTILSYNVNDKEQRVLVTAENGSTNTYIITYARKQSANALLADILIDGESLYRFRPDSFNYSITLPKEAKVIPNVFPVAQLENQTITTWFCRPDGVTEIKVVAQDGTEAKYTIAFPKEKSANTRLGSLSIDNITRDVNTTEFVMDVPFGTGKPYDVAFEKAEPTQSIDYVEAPVSGVTKITVKAENGDTRLYTIRYNIAQPQGTNIIKSVKYSYVTAADETKTGSLTPVAGDNIINLPYGTKSFEVSEVEKNYPEQSIVFYNGGIRRGATIIASANREGVNDVTYTITPKMEEFDKTGKLQTLTFKGNALPNWRPDVYNYMIDVTAQPTAADFAYTTYEDGKTVTVSAFDAKKKQVTFTVDGGETYSVCWFYVNDGKYLKDGKYVDYMDFSAGNWEPAAKKGYHPHGFKVPGDCVDSYDWKLTWPLPKTDLISMTYTAGKEAMAGGANGALLSTTRGASLNGSIPGMMTMGNMSISLGNAGGSTSSMSYDKSTGVQFRNTPEQLAFEATPLSALNISEWYCNLTVAHGTTAKNIRHTGDYSNLNTKRLVAMDINPSSLGTIARYTLTLNAAGSDNAATYGHGALDGTVEESTLLLENFHFVYNSELTAATVNGKSTVKDGNTFTYTLADDEFISGIPALKFTGKVHDQTQTIEWLNNGEWVNGELKAKVTNYGENSADNTVYTVVLKRDAVTLLDYTADFGSYTKTTKDDTVFVAMPYGVKTMPDFNLTPESIHQRFELKRGLDNTLTVTVFAEDGNSKTTVYAFRETKTNSTDLTSLSAMDNNGHSVALETAGENEYTVTAEQMPIIEFENENAGQTVALTYTASGATVTITAADGKTQRTCTITRLDPVVTTTGQIDAFEINGNDVTGLGGTNLKLEQERPDEVVVFKRKDDRDSVVFVQTPDRYEWQVYGSVKNTYKWIFPTSPSSNADLASIQENGVDLADFLPSDTIYPIYSDTTIWLEAIAAEAEQTLITSQTAIEGGTEYTIEVTPANPAAPKKSYKVSVRKPKSNNALLAGIMLDSVMIDGFDPAQNDYTIVLPTPAVKAAQPIMPSVTYIAGQKGQKVDVEAYGIGEQSTLTVTSEDGKVVNEYTLTVMAEPSHCVDLSGITVNGAILDHFEAGRHFYSISLKTSDIDVDYTSADRFQNVSVTKKEVRPEQEYIYTLHVVAEDGTTEADYQVEIYVENQSTDAFLANITLNGKDFVDFERALNADLNLTFDQGQNNYLIYLPAGTTILPEVNAQLKMDGQSVVIEHIGKDTIQLHVTASDNVSTNNYTLHFVIPQSTNADLSMIFLDGKELPDFDPQYYFYQVSLPTGVHSLPEVAAQKGEASQTLLPVVVDNDKLQATIQVLPEDTTVRGNTYVVVFHYTQSDIDSLLKIYADGAVLPGFEPQKYFYSLSLPVGTAAFPDLSWDEGDEWQTISMDTVSVAENALVRQINVTSESGKKNTYTVSYTILKSEIDTLQMIFVDQKQLPDFNPYKGEYYYQLTSAQANELNGALPVVEYIVGDEYQNVMVSQSRDTLSGKSLGYKSIVAVTAATGASRTYTIHYPVELSVDATLNMIMLGGKPLTNYDAERFNYRVEIDREASVPVVSVVKKEDAQTYEIRVIEDTVYVDVTAEDISHQQTYTLVFERVMSSITTLRDIILTDAEGVTFTSNEFPYRPEIYSYTVNLKYNATLSLEQQLPDMETVFYDAQQSADTVHYLLPNGDLQVDITVTAPNGEDQAIYSIIFHFVKPSDATLLSISIDGNPIADFTPADTEYEFAHPYGSTEADYFTLEDVTYVLSDSLAVSSAKMDENGTLYITVIAQDGTTEVTYIITQKVALDGDCSLKSITLDGELIKDFDSEITFYTYYLFEGITPPSITAIPNSENAEVSVREVSAGDTCMIICTAMDGSERRYYIHFAISSINTDLDATANDVIVKRIPGSLSLFVGTVRKAVSFALYDQNGHLISYQPVPVADPNDAEVVLDANNMDRLNDIVNNRSGLVINIDSNRIYFYTFFLGDKTKIASGKLIAKP